MSSKVDVEMAIERLKDDPEIMSAVKRLKNLMVVVRWTPVAVVLAAESLWGGGVGIYVLFTWYVARYAQYRHDRLMVAGARLVGTKLEDK